VQHNSTTDRLDFNVRLRYAFAEGTDVRLLMLRMSSRASEAGCPCSGRMRELRELL
jgi:hypothetical protein